MTRRNVIIAVVAFAFGIALGLLWLREPTEPLTRENLAAARRVWRQSAVSDYSLHYTMNRDLYEVSVEDGIVISAKVNGRQPRSESFREYSVEGLFALLEMELENLADPAGPFAGRAESVLARVRFNPDLGYPERYLRSAGGFGRGADIQVLEFIKHSDAKAPDKIEN